MRDPEGFSGPAPAPQEPSMSSQLPLGPGSFLLPSSEGTEPSSSSPAPSPPQGGLLGGQREWGLSPQPGIQSPREQGLPGATAAPADFGPRGPPRPAPPVTGRLPAPPQAKVGLRGPKPPFPRGGHPASTGAARGCVHSPEPPSTSARCPVPSSQGPRLPPAPRPCQWPLLSTPRLGPHQCLPFLCPLCPALSWPQ